MNKWIRMGAVALAVTGCKGEANLPGDCDCGDKPVIVVRAGDVERLYEVVGDPRNADKCVRLEPGTYDLDPALEPSGQGNLVLQPGMVLVGSNQYRDGEDLEGNASPDGIWDPWDPDADPEQYPDPSTETVLDGGGLPTESVEASSCIEPPDVDTRNASLITLVDDAALRCLSVTGFYASFVGVVALDTRDLGVEVPDAGEITAEVSDCVIEGGHVGIGVNVDGCEVRGRTASITLERNVVTGAGYAGAFFMNTFTEDVAVEVSVSHNRFEANGRGLQAVGGVNADRCAMEVTSTANSYSHGAQSGLSLMGQADTPNIADRNGGHDNTLTWTSHGDRIVSNGDPSSMYQFGGVGVSGSTLHRDRPLGASGNHADAHLIDTVFVAGEGEENQVGGDRLDLRATGYWGIFATTVYTHNTVTLELEGCVSDGTPVYYDHSDPDDPSGTNLVTIVGGAEGLAANTEGIPGAVEY